MVRFRTLSQDNDISKEISRYLIKVYHILSLSRAWQSANFDFYLRKKPVHFYNSDSLPTSKAAATE